MKPFDQSGAFRTAIDAQSGGLRVHAVKSAGITAASQVLRVFLQVVSTVVLARLLTPSDFGLMTIVTTFSLLFVNFGLNGFTEAVIQRENIDHQLASNLFWVNFGICFSLTVGFAAAGPALAWFYHDGRIAGVAAAVALTILFTGLSVMHLALLRRGMRLGAVAANDVIAQAVSVGVSVTFALLGSGYWSLVAGAVALAVVTGVGAWFQCRWIPGWPRRGAGTRPAVRFALNVYGYFTVNYFSRNLDNLLVGWAFGSGALGFYKKAFDLAIFPIVQAAGPANAVAIPTLSRLTGDQERYSRYILRSFALLAFVGMGVGACLTLVGRDVIRVLLGPQWEEAGRIFVLFGPGIGAFFIYRISGWLHFSMGTGNRLLRWGIIELVVLGTLFCIGLPWGPVGVGAAWGVSCWILTVPAILYAPRPPQLTLLVMINAIWRYILASVLAGLACALLVRWSVFQIAWPGVIGSVVQIPITSSLFGVLYLGAIVLLHGGWAPLLEVKQLIRDMRPVRQPWPQPVAPTVPSA